MRKRKIFIGTSGWMYKDWGKRFYPAGLKEEPLEFFSREFKTVEINFSFYHLPKAETFSKWRRESSRDFIFSVKLGQYLTHRKRLILDADSRPYLDLFLKNLQELEKKLAVILIQLPPSFRKNIERLDHFLAYFESKIKKLKFKTRAAVEFRHESWFVDEIYDVLKKYKTALVIASTPEFRREVFTADFAYIRMHGSEKHDQNYLERDLRHLKKEINGYPARVKKVFIYFNNDYSAYAIENARLLASIV